MGFPHLRRPPAPSLELWVQTFSCQKRPCGLEEFSSFVKRRRDRRFQKIPINREWNPKLLIWQNSIEGKVDCWYEN